MSTITVVALVAVLALILWWRPVLKFAAITVVILAAVGAAEVLAAITSGFAPS